jgi:hypothetical protein
LGTIESWDCEPNGGEQSKPEEDDPPCFVEPDSLFDGNKFPTLQRGETSRVRAPRSNEPCNDPSNPPGRGSLRAGCGTLQRLAVPRPLGLTPGRSSVTLRGQMPSPVPRKK